MRTDRALGAAGVLVAAFAVVALVAGCGGPAGAPPTVGSTAGSTDAAATPALTTPAVPTPAVSTPTSTSAGTVTPTAPPTTATPTTATPSTAAPSTATPTACAGLPGAHAMWLPIPGGRLEANSVGHGPDAVVFLHEIGESGMCGFAPYAAWPVAHYPSVQAVLVNRCGYGATVCPNADTSHDIVTETEPAVVWARSHGAHRVTLVGASGGGLDALEAAALAPGVTALVDISGDVDDTGLNPMALARRVHVPSLLAVAPDDPYCSIASVRAIYAAIPAGTKRLVIQTDDPGAHGWDLLMSPENQALPLATVVARWSTGATAPAVTATGVTA